MDLPLTTKIKVGFYVVKNLITKPTFSKYNPNDTKGFYPDPNPLTIEMLEQHPVFFSPHIAAWVVSLNRKDTFDMAKDERFSVNFSDWKFAPTPIPSEEQDELQQLLSGLLMSAPEADHKRIRRLVQPAFLPKNIIKMDSAIDRIVNEALDQAQGEFNLVDIIKSVPLKAIAELAGVEISYSRQFKGLADSILATYSPAPESDPALAIEGIHIVRKVIEERRENPQDDFISVLVATADEDGDRLSIDEVMAFVASLLTAGPDTTAYYLIHVVYTLLQHQDVVQQLIAQPELIDNAITEATRLSYFAHSGGIRFATCDAEIAGQKIQKGEMIKFNVNSVNMDSNVFPDPLRFDMHRPNLKEAWIFGAGRHFCVGAALAKSISTHFVKSFIERLPNAELISQPEYEQEFINRKMAKVMVRANT